jgi:hypothetical protein
MFVSCTVFVLLGRGLCDGPIPRPEESYRLWYVSECDQVKINNVDTYCELVEEGRTTKRKKVYRLNISWPSVRFRLLIYLEGVGQITEWSIEMHSYSLANIIFMFIRRQDFVWLKCLRCMWFFCSFRACRGGGTLLFLYLNIRFLQSDFYLANNE